MKMEELTYYRPKHFKIYELVPPELYRLYGDNCLVFLDSRMLWSIDKIWLYLKTIARLQGRLVKGKTNGGFSITINDWWWGGDYTESGLRMPDSNTGAALSMHKRATGKDLKVSLFKASEVQEILLKAKEKGHICMKYINRMELDTPSWTHIGIVNSSIFKTFKAS